ncbi:MAG: GIY-YIG nuclease family protein [Ignavibacteria bacterium]|nr:GIY-YIG nuclease family protein [Ignavibacteria bacterium]
MKYFVYILASQRNGTLYVGFTDDLKRRIREHKEFKYDGFTKRYKVTSLVYYEDHLEMEDAMKREKQLKKWDRKWKIELIEKTNPKWKDLSLEFGKELSQTEILDLLFKDKKH